MAHGRVVRAGDAGSFWTAGSDSDSRLEVMVGEVQYLAGPSLHIHEYQEDTFFVLEGVVTVQIDEEVIELAVGDFASAPPGVSHTFTNTDPNRTARMLNAMAPARGSGQLLAALHSGADQADLEQLGMLTYGKSVGPSLPEKLGLR